MDDRIKNARLVVSTSGGKDSTAMCLMLMEMGYTSRDYDRVFFDTGWEHQETYKYLDELEQTVGPILRLRADVPVKPEHKEIVADIESKLGFESPMVRRIFKGMFFSSRRMKWCTKELKLNPAKKYFKELDCDFVNVVGIRREESKRRSGMTEWEWSDTFDCWIWRPIIGWTEADVINIHKRFKLRPNPLYLQGSHRVGCWPCIMSRKKEINQLDDHRVSIIRDIENAVTSLRPKDKQVGTFFQTRTASQIMQIDEVMRWAATSRGGKQYELFSTDEPTCVKWGLCNV